ncbi:MAG: pyridoxal-phosphate dependent enzyme [Calditrichae bacterium]|nr:pyridoxal-phosphate dependent enzyme [Calditrichota bacterium]MCB9058822.1 pyridoxal-phosphate dependent enzyme [Calditrichia bacterium]
MNQNLFEVDKLLDGASGIGTSIAQETRELSEFVKDKSNDLIDRVSAYEDIISLEIGDTSLSRARNIEREANMRQIYLKFEGGNPTGTQKDRIAFAQCLDALRRGYETVTLATCGNYGAAMALAAELAGLKCIICIPESYHTKRINEMSKMGSEIERVSGSYEDSVDYSIKMAWDKEYYDANPGGVNTSIQLKAYAEIAMEIYDILRDAPKIVAAPVSNGTLLAGVFRGFVSLYKRGKTSRLPKMIAASSTNKNPIIVSFKKGLKSCRDLNPTGIKETKINEPLINWHSFDGDEALWALYDSDGASRWVSDKKLMDYSKILKDREGLNVLPASTAGLIGLLEMHKEKPFEGDRYVTILTGRK